MSIRSIVQSVLAMKMEIRFLNSAVLSNAISFAYDYDITVYDASYISLAQNIGYSLITADDKLYKKVKEIEFVHSLAQI
ncbi:MAG: type II toxin-antitoxin system VapC family toxin [bacterium]|nr:type II toxin-antitoxin system VapC family toxin [bacterium]